MAAQELCRGQEGAAVWGCGQSLSAPFLVYTVPRILQPGSSCQQIPGAWMSLTHLGRSLLLHKDFCLLHIK